MESKVEELNLKKFIKSGRSKSGDILGGIDTSPITVPEEVGSVVVTAFGRFNPITSGHEKLIKKVLTIARKNRATPKVFLSHSQDSKKNPLSYDQKIKYAKKAFGKAVEKSPANTVIKVLQSLEGKFKNVIFIAGSDRIKEFESLLNRYNGKEYNFDSIKVISAGQRDPDDEGVAGMSASKLRQLAKDGMMDEFKKGLPSGLQGDAENIYKVVRHQMGINEDLDLNEVLNMQQRMKRKILMRKIRGRIKLGKRRWANKRATTEKLKSRAQKQARNTIRRRLAPGVAYSDLPIAAKIQLDKRLEKKKALINRLARKLIPKIKKAEIVRMTSKKEDYDFNTHQIMIKDEIHTFNDHEVIRLVDTILEEIEIDNIIDEGIEKSLFKKSEKSGYSYGTLREVFLRGIENHKESSTTLSETQYAFGRVNSFISGGRAAEEDFDLIEGSLLPFKISSVENDLKKALSPFLKKESRYVDILHALKKYEEKYLCGFSVVKTNKMKIGNFGLAGFYSPMTDQDWVNGDGADYPIEMIIYFSSKETKIAFGEEDLRLFILGITEVLSHEWTHLVQGRKNGWRLPESKSKYLYKVENKVNGQYYAADEEIEAFSRNIAHSMKNKFGSVEKALEVLRKPTPTLVKSVPGGFFGDYYNTFKDFNHPVMKRLFKKVVYFLEKD